MGWSIGYDDKWARDIGYGVPAYCDHPECTAEINRGLSYVCCGEEPYGGKGCGLYFCPKHQRADGKCERCVKRRKPFNPKPDHPRWVRHKLEDASWGAWRADWPRRVEAMRKQLASCSLSCESAVGEAEAVVSRDAAVPPADGATAATVAPPEDGP